mmetsp:Transcript_105779/g.329743  ORF Transcript_105779/g.329743 Transcript_105779/m.329743 type:complete len:127 (+) Transcript_105779:32-412(+)
MGAIMGFDIPVSSLAPLVRRQHGVNVWVALLGIGAATVAVVSAMMRRRAVNTHRGDGAQGVDDGLQQDRRKDSPKLQGSAREALPRSADVSAGSARGGSTPGGGGGDQLFFSLLEAYARVDAQGSL